jgi:hypothetical protein
MICADAATVSLFNQLLCEAQQLAPDRRVLQAIRRQRLGVSPHALLMLVDQILVSLAPRA